MEEIKRSYHSNGQLRSETPYRNGKINGIAREWRYKKKEQLWFEMVFVNDLRRGPSKWFYDNGLLDEQITYKNDIPHGARVDFKYYLAETPINLL